MLHKIERENRKMFADYVKSAIASSDYTVKEVALATWPNEPVERAMRRMREVLRGERQAGAELIETLKQLKVID